MKKTHYIDGDLKLACGLKFTIRRPASIMPFEVTCEACRETLQPKIFTEARDLALFIYHGEVFQELCNVKTIGTELEGKVFFNKKSREHKHVTLINDNGCWRRKRFDESIYDPEGKIKWEKPQAQLVDA